MRLACSISLALAAAISAGQFSTAIAADSSVKAESTQSYIIKFNEPGLLHYDGGVGGIRATAPSANGQRKLDADSPAAQQYRSHLADARAGYMDQMHSAIGRVAAREHDYFVMFNGVALQLSAEEAERIARMDFVQSIAPAGVYELDTDSGPAFIGAPAVWNGTSTFGSIPTRGEGVVVGVIDSGANSDHPSFANDAMCGFSAGSPKLLSAKDCNQPSCVGGDPEDTSTASGGHGVHTSSTAAGNALTAGLMVNGVTLPFNISGVAPCAAVRTYKACEDTCPGAALTAAIQEAILDGVDVINYSISGGTSPWNDLDRNFLDMVNADIYVAASAGNTRAATPDPVGAVNHRGPWVMTVANSSHDRIVAFDVDVAGGPQDSGGVPGTGIDFPNGATTSDVALAVSLGNETGCTATGGFGAGTMTGRIALISRGSCNFSEKVDNAAGAGATGVIVYNNAPGLAIVMGGLETTTIPSAMVSNPQGIAIRDFLVGTPAAQMTVTGPAARVLDPAFGDILNASSLRGPQETFDVTKPDITGPGTNIFAAVGAVDGEFGFLSGTSMSSPHLAGAGALLRAANPTWTPMEVKSAIQLTASRNGLSDNATTPWDADEVGNGRVDLNKAAVSGLVMNESFANFLAANP
ncbi:MAG: S8 family serine peptidase, partial [Xanthomonadales bacterium]|nr:S8 family serine peptidase [Xanthomonadales bacterium]